MSSVSSSPAPHDAPAAARYLTTDQVADLLGLSPDTVLGWRKRRRGPPFVRLANNAVRYPEGALHRWAAQRLVELEPAPAAPAASAA